MQACGTALTVEYNPEGCRRGAFEVTFIDERGKRTQLAFEFPFATIHGIFFSGTELWSGLKKGPPRKLKFPEPDGLIPDLVNALKV